jgi:capsular polysaccharide export protein
MTQRFLFLQGPPGPFFAQLGRALAARGCATFRIQFNGGDWLDWHGADATAFRGCAEDWPGFLRDFLHEHAITDIILFGDCRPLHRIACAEAGDFGVRVHVFEEGYIRPDWITLEQGGVNGNSRLPREPETYLKRARGLVPIASHPPVRASFAQRFREAWSYYAAAWLFAPRFPHFRSHRPFSAPAEAAGWLARLTAQPMARIRSARVKRKLPWLHYFVLPLQLDSDYQLRLHSPFAGMTEAIERVLESFAASAPAQCALIVKLHPLDNGLRDWRRVVRRAAQRLGIADRVHFLDRGDIAKLVRDARGVVTVNSTTGTLALAHRVPVHVLGRAVYDVPGITHQASLERFWNEPGTVQLEIFEAFRRVLADQCLIRGGFSSREGRRLLLPAAVERLTRASETVPCAIFERDSA